MRALTAITLVSGLAVLLATEPVRAAGNHYGWCRGVGNPHHSADCGHSSGGGSTSGQTPSTTPSSNQMPSTSTLPPTKPTGGSQTQTVVAPPQPQVKVPPKQQTAVPNPVLPPQKTPPDPQIVTPVPPQRQTLVPPPQQIQAPYPVPQKTQVPPQRQTLVPPPQQIQAPYPVPQKTQVPPPQQAQVPPPQQLPRQQTPYLVPQPLLLARPNGGTGTRPQPRPTTIAKPSGQTPGTVTHSTTHVEPPKASGHIPIETGRQAPHQIPRFADSAGDAPWHCIASGYGRRNHVTYAGAIAQRGALTHIDSVDAIARDVPARHPRHSACVISVQRRNGR